MVDCVPNPFPAMRYHVRAVVERPFQLPDFAGSTLRGLFGHALRKASCTTLLPECSACPLYRNCTYPRVFETPPPLDAPRGYSQVPQPYVVEPPPLGARDYRPGQVLEFSFVLIGPALADLALIVLAWQRALQAGIGKDKGTARLDFIHNDLGELVFDRAKARILDHTQTLDLRPAPPGNQTLRVDFKTPLNLRREGAELNDQHIRVEDLFRALMRRTSQLVHLQLGQILELDFAALVKQAQQLTAHRDTRDTSWQRWSNRQKQLMKVGGVTGRWILTGDFSGLWPFLYLGQWLHVGKKATLGLGHYTLSDAPEKLP